MNKKETLKVIKAELEGNLSVLIDRKKKDSFSDKKVIFQYVHQVASKLDHFRILGIPLICL